MKKQFKILSTVIIIMLFLCGIQNAEMHGKIKNEVRELSTNGPSLSNESDFLLIGPEGQILFCAGPGYPTKKIQCRPSPRSSSYTIDRSDLSKTMFRLNGLCGVD